MENNNNSIEGRSSEVADGGAESPPAPSKPKKDISTLADPNCKRCFGTGRIGFRHVKGIRRVIPCRCVQKNVFMEILRRDVEKRESEGGCVSLKLTDERLKQIGIEVGDERT